MNEYLKVSVNRYPKDLESTLIHPISNVDAEIIVELIEILKKVDRPDVKVLLDKYKYLKDEKIRDSLLQWNIDHPIGTEADVADDSGEIQPKSKRWIPYIRKFIYIKNFRIELAFVNSYEKDDEFNFSKGMTEYFIYINRIPDTTTVKYSTSHKVIKYNDGEKRDADFETLDNAMQESEDIKFVNERDE